MIGETGLQLSDPVLDAAMEGSRPSCATETQCMRRSVPESPELLVYRQLIRKDFLGSFDLHLLCKDKVIDSAIFSPSVVLLHKEQEPIIFHPAEARKGGEQKGGR